MKLTTNRLVGQVHIKDLDEAGVITPDMEEKLPEILRQRLQDIRSRG